MKRFLYIISTLTSLFVLSTAVQAQTIVAGTVTGNISACVGTASALPLIQQFTVSGNGLSADITATAPTGFEVSLTSGSGFGSSVTLAETGGVVNSAVVYVRSAASASAGSINGNVTLTSTGATNQNAAVSGTVSALPTVAAVANQTINNGVSTIPINFSGTGNTYNWTNNTPGIGLPASGTDNIGSFAAVNTGSTPVVATITVTPVSAQLAYIANGTSGNVSVINTATNTVIATIPSGDGSYGISVSPDGTRVYITNSRVETVSVINTTSNAVVATIPVGVGPGGVVVSPDNNWVYVANQVSGTVSVINTATNTIISTIKVGGSPTGISISPDGSRLYVANGGTNSVAVINTTTNSIVSVIPVNAGPTGVLVGPDGLVYVANTNAFNISVINPVSNTVISTISTAGASYGDEPTGLAISPDGNRLYVTNYASNNVLVFNTTTYAVIADIPVGAFPVGVSVSPDGNWVYESNASSNTVSVINATTNAVIATIPVGQDPVSFGNFITSGTGCSGAPVTFTITVNPTAPAVIVAGAATGIISACAGTASASPNIQQFTVSGSILTGNITATAPTGFEVSLSAATGYGSSVVLTPLGGTVSNTTVYIRSTASASAGNITGNVTLSSPGVTSQSVAVAGTVNALQTVNTVSNQTLANGALTTTVNFTGTADGYSWVNNTPGIGLAASGTGNIAAFTAVNTGASAITATITVTPVSAGYAYIENQVSNTVSVINTATNEVASIINVELAPSGAAVSPDGTRVYITEQGSNDVSVINTLTNTVIATIPVGTSPYGISESLDGTRVYVANINSNNVSVINTATNAVIATIPVGLIPIGISVSPDGSRVYVTNTSSNTVSVINTLTNSVISTIPVGKGPFGISVSPDGSKVYVTVTGPENLSVINTTTNSVISTIMVGSQPDAVSVSPDGLRVYVVNGYSNTVSIINTTNNTVVKTVNVGSFPGGLSVSPDGYWVYVSNSGSNTVSVINTATNTVNAAIPVGTLPIAFGNFVKGGTNCIGPPITFTITVNPTVPAVIVAGAATGSISACAGTVSASPNIQQFTVSGSDLTADIVATAPNNFEISLTAESGFGNTVTLPQSAGVVSSTIIYVRSAASAPAGSISGNVTLVSGTANQKVPVTGTINAPPVVNPVSNQTFVNGTTTTAINFTGTGDSYTWTNDNPAIGLPATGTGDIPSFTEVNNSAGPVIATITVTPNSATACSGTPVTFTITVNPTFATTGTPLPLTTIYGTPSTSTTFTVSVSNLTAGVLVTPPTGFEVSTDGINYSATITVAGVGTIGPLYPSGTVYIRLASSTPVGDYSGNIVLSSTGATNVNVEMPVSTVTPAPLTITADDKGKALGEANPVLTVTYSGFVNSDGPAQLTTQPAITTTALTTSPAGQYPITAAGATDPNYTITYVPGVLTVNPQPEMISVPNAFTPNGDGINDTWDIKYLNTFPNCTVAVFNRWGQNVYSSNGYGIPWDGSYKGSGLPTGTYYYLIDLRNGLNVLSGYVAIIR